MDTLQYLQRIDYHGDLAPTAVTLTALHIAHMRTAPFENLDIHLGRPIDLRLDAFYDKIVVRRRGGFCYELNGLFAWLLAELGYAVTKLSARDIKEDGSVGPAYDHLTLQVMCPADVEVPKTPWLVDVGWGDSFTEPLRLDRIGEEKPEGLRAYRIECDDDHRFLWQRGYDGEWRPQYRFTLKPRGLNEFEETCRYHQTSPKSTFTQHRICSLATIDGRISLDDHRLIVTKHGQRNEQPVNEAAYAIILADQFGVKVEPS